jgi:SAM-dependent methyltransferase
MSEPDLDRLGPTQRFSDRASDYVRSRPGYPPAVLHVLRDELDLTPAHVVADVGSGTGLLTRLFLDQGNVVYGVEPNRAMAAAAEAAFAGDPKFHSIDGRAEATGLPPLSVDLVAAGQAFHWFEVAKAREEFRRVLRPPFRVALVWNLRRADTTPFLRAYEAFLHRWAIDYREVSARYAVPKALRDLFGGDYANRTFENAQVFDLEGLQGRLLSSSYAPPPSHERHRPMLRALAELFATHAEGGHVSFEYDTEVYFGVLR